MSGSATTLPYSIPVQGQSPLQLTGASGAQFYNTPAISQSPETDYVLPNIDINAWQGQGIWQPTQAWSETPFGGQYPNGIPASFLDPNGTQLNLQTPIGIDTLAAEIQSGVPGTSPIDPYALQAAFGNEPTANYPYATPGSSDYTIGGSGYAELTPAGVSAAEQAANQEAKNSEVGFSPMLALAVPGIVGGALTGLAGLGVLPAADAAGDISTSDLGAITAGAGDAGGTAPVAGTAVDIGSLGSGAFPNDISLMASTAQNAAGVPVGMTSSLSMDPASLAAAETGLTPSAITVPDASSLLGGVTAPDITAGAGGGAGAAAGAAGGGGGGFWSGLTGDLSSVMNSPWTKALGILGSGAGLASSLLKANQANPIPGESNISNLAGSLAAQGTQLSNYINTGTLPPGVQSALNQATQDAITATKAKYAGLGLSGSTMEQQEINTINQNSITQGASIATGLLQSGSSMSGLAGDLYNALVGTNTSLNNSTMSAIANLASALSGGGRTTIVNTGAPAT
jgi:hypothetical protein